MKGFFLVHLKAASNCICSIIVDAAGMATTKLEERRQSRGHRKLTRQHDATDTSCCLATCHKIRGLIKIVVQFDWSNHLDLAYFILKATLHQIQNKDKSSVFLEKDLSCATSFPCRVIVGGNEAGHSGAKRQFCVKYCFCCEKKTSLSPPL